MFVLVSVHFSLMEVPQIDRKASPKSRPECKHTMNDSTTKQVTICVNQVIMLLPQGAIEIEMRNFAKANIVFVSLHRSICPNHWDHDPQEWTVNRSKLSLGHSTFKVSNGSSRPSLWNKNIY